MAEPDSPYPPAPWRLRGWGAATAHAVDIARVRRVIPKGVHIVPVWPGKTLGGIAFLSYERGSTEQGPKTPPDCGWSQADRRRRVSLRWCVLHKPVRALPKGGGDARVVGAIKRGVILVNVARDLLVVERALYDAVCSEVVRG